MNEDLRPNAQGATWLVIVGLVLTIAGQMIVLTSGASIKLIWISGSVLILAGVVLVFAIRRLAKLRGK